MKRMITTYVTASRKNKFGYTNHRKGRIFFDNIDVYNKTFSYNNLTQKVCDMNFIFDTLAHINYAAYLDAEDWTAEEVADAVADSIDVKELLDSWNRLAIQHMSEIPNDCVSCDVTLTMYGIGDKSIKIYTTVYGRQISRNEFDYSDIHTLFKDNYISTDPKIYSTIKCTPNKLKLLIREAIKYLTAGL